MDFAHDIDNCLLVLHQGGLIVYPTDTIWGIGCDATNPEAVAKVFALKKRDDSKSLIVLLADEREVINYVAQPDLQVFDYLQQVQKPTTVIYEGAIGLAENLVPPDGTIAIRIVNDPFCKHLLKRFRKPIVSTSANISGDPSPASFKDVSPAILKGADYVVTHRQQDTTPASPSAVVRWNRDNTVTVVRD